MSTHTPGPWHYESGAVWEHEGDSDTPGTMAIATRGTRRGNSAYRSPAESDANMRLISAAPELYDVVFKTQGWLAELCSLIARGQFSAAEDWVDANHDWVIGFDDSANELVNRIEGGASNE